MAPVVTFLNFKGGVGKTTTLVNLAAYLAQHGKRVLIVDCDPQCNATSMVLPLPDFESPQKGTSVFDVLRPALTGESYGLPAKSVKLVETQYSAGVFILRGDLNLLDVEEDFAHAWGQAITDSIRAKKLYSLLRNLLNQLSDLHRLDYIFCDIAPSAAAWTNSVIVSCDGFFMPLTPDALALTGLRFAWQRLGDLLNRHQAIINTFPPFGLQTFPGRPAFLGAVLQRVHTFGSAPINSQRNTIKSIENELRRELEAHPAIPVSDKLDPLHPIVASFPQRHSFVAAADLRLPVFEADPRPSASMLDQFAHLAEALP